MMTSSDLTEHAQTLHFLFLKW